MRFANPVTWLSIPEALAHRAYRQDELRLLRILLELLAQMAHVDVDGARLAVVGAAPERLEQHLPRVDPARVRRHRAQDLELDVRELHRLVSDAHRPLADVDHEPVRRDHLLVRRGRARRGGAAEERAYPAAELADRERLRDVVVGAELEADHL